MVSSAGTTTLSYDYEGRVTSVAGPGVSDSFAYNGLDTRVGKVDSGGAASYRRDGAEVTSPVLSDGAADDTPGVSQRRSGSTTYDLHDQLGTATKQTDASASVSGSRTYDAFGLLVASTGTPQGPFGFAATSGYQEDGDTGLKLLGHRYYDPSTGRFLTRDPAQAGRNMYAYCNENPLKAVDAKGYTPAWLRNTAEWVVDQATGGLKGATKLVGTVVGTVTTIGAVGAFFEGLYEGAVGGQERIDSNRMYDQAHDSGTITDEQWAGLKNGNGGEAIGQGGNIFVQFWNMQSDFW